MSQISIIPLRHPELVSGSIVPPTLMHRGETKAHPKVLPVRVGLLDQVDLPLSVPVLELLFARDRGDHVAVHFKPDQPLDAVPFCKPRHGTFAVLPKPGQKVGRDANVERAARLAGKYVNAGISFAQHGAEHAVRWTLKQVQGDKIVELVVCL